MKQLRKLSLKSATLMNDNEMKMIKGGSGCPTGQVSCTCDGKNYGCVSSLKECWDKC